MHLPSSFISKVEKAKLYASERERAKFLEFKVRFRGNHAEYLVSFNNGKWTCTCRFFRRWGTCSHIMALEQILQGMLL